MECFSESRKGEAPGIELKTEDWYRISILFNKRTLKFYVNGTCICNIPRCDAPTRFQVYSYSGVDTANTLNVCIAKGAEPLYDRMMSDGKVITYDVTFDVGKVTIKPELMGEINRIVTLMNESPDLKFTVELHRCDRFGGNEPNVERTTQPSNCGQISGNGNFFG